MGRMNEKSVTIITAAAMVLLAVGLGAATYFFFYKKNQEAQEELRTREERLAALTAKENELNGVTTGNPPKHIPGWKDKLPDMRKDDEERVDVLPTREERRVTAFHDTIYSLARESNVIIRKTEDPTAKASPRGPAAALATAGKGQFEKVACIYHVEGVFADVAAFLSRVEGMKRFTKIVSVKFAPNPRTIVGQNSEKTQVMFVLLDMEINFYFLPS